ncbi:DUF4167 domain-containing protein [Defluviimonas sp. WL0002]|uniref:DUF4167 domain-containing protein n=1 Tax=Albidovulum marisflavi TaxID=2984159 RepID=A0ABT2ZH98_9RHOB|nr:DUF4167 domain-containing protein [Defluviimonas sp. WL0002]MCV2870504.1 DUF4167 domain-containing protein [Defluviimonas sp. WL0002]
MRSSKSRSRSKSNRQRSLGNIINRVFDSSGPEGKVRGTPQQIIDKYLMLARDAQLSNDRVAEQNFLQHAEHYTRLLGEAQKELQREQEQRQQQNQQQGGHNGERNHGGRDRFESRGERSDDSSEAHGLGAETDSDDSSGLVETPEARAAVGEDKAASAEDAGAEAAQTEGETRAPREPRKERKPRGEGAPRSPRRPREKREQKQADAPGNSEDNASAAE